jgi:hypothetical protein
VATSSQEAGFLAPSSADPYDDPLDDILQAVIVGITGLPASLVRPRWQPNPPQMPDFTENWCAFGVTDKNVDAFAYDDHNPAGSEGAGQSIIERDEIVSVLHSFYGPASGAVAERFRDGFEIGQNRAALLASGVALIEMERAVSVPALLQETWVKRVDVNVLYRRRTRRTFEVRSLLSAQGQLDTEQRITPLNVNQT